MAGDHAPDVKDALHEIAARSEFLHERLARARWTPGPEADSMSEGSGLPHELLSRWQAALGARGLERRLAWDGLDSRSARRILQSPSARGREPNARWMAVLEDALARAPSVLEHVTEGRASERYRYLDDAAKVAFEHILLPFVEAGLSELEREAGDAIEIVSSAARASLARALLELLSQLALSTLELEFSIDQSVHGRFPWVVAPRSNEAYQRFVSEMLGGRLIGLLMEYAVLARLLGSSVCGWARSHAQLADRLRRDWPAIRLCLGAGEDDCRIEGIAPYRSDPHDDGHAVSLIGLKGGHSLVYKPRALDMEEGFGGLLRWANARGFSRPYRPVELIPRDGYGWMAYVAPAPCASASEVEDFYVRIGGLLCLLSFLQGTDVHHENLIACGSQPVIVDLETLLHPRLPPGDLGPGSRQGPVGGDLAASLVETGLLPVPSPGGAPARVDFSALGATEPFETPFHVVRCDGVNSDGMTLTHVAYQVTRRDNVPTLNGRPEIAALHGEAIVAGFREMFLLIVRGREALSWPLGQLAGRRGRFIARSTNAYGLLLQESLEPRYMRDAAARGILFERLRRAAVERADRPPCWSILDAELQDLERMNVPYLVAVCDERAPRLSGGGAPSDCWIAPLDQARERIQRATEADLEGHLDLLRQELAALRCRPAARGGATPLANTAR